MRNLAGFAIIGLSGVLLGSYWLFATPRVDDLVLNMDAASIERGSYLVNAGGCISCHEGVLEDGLSGGMALESEFGTFYAPNITPDNDTGIGGWQAKDFLLAMKHGRSPSGSFYFPAFPYRSYSGMTDEDVLDIATYLLSQDAVSYQVPSHETPVWLQRWMLAGWNKLANVLEGTPAEVDTSDPRVERGAYLARSLGHCGECHTPRNSLGITLQSQEFAGATMGESHADEIDLEALANWSEDDFAFFLLLGMKPDGEFVGGEMEAVIEHNTSTLNDEDRQAMAAFFKSER